MDLFLVGEEVCQGLLPIVRIIVAIVKILMIAIPIGLIVFGTIDLGKAVIASDEKEVKQAQSRLIKRFIYAALVFFIPMLVGVIMNLVADNVEDDDTNDWKACWDAAK